jgi:3-hydroxymyristoyl/3-hydroxydecanoyl-(acyl carrier protein) dehydratase
MTIDDLRQAFTSTEWPYFLGLDAVPNGYALTLDIHAGIRWFDGHFPQQPVLAGIVQTHWAAELGKFLFPLGEKFVRIDNLKFQTVVLPGQQLRLLLEHIPNSGALKFRYVQDELNFSEGKCVFELEPGNAE